MILNIGGGASGYALVIKSTKGVTVTITKDGNTHTEITDSNGVAVFSKLPSGTWTVTLQKGGSTKTQTVNITQNTHVEIPIIWSTVSVTYPADSVCTCTKGNIVLEASDTSGSFTFNIPELGDWVVSCNNGLTGDERKEASETVSITSDGQSVSIELFYRLYLYKNGDRKIDVTGDWAAKAEGLWYGNEWGVITPSITFNADSMYIVGTENQKAGIVRTNNPIDITKYKTAKVKVSVTSMCVGRVGFIDSPAWIFTPSVIVTLNTCSETVFSIDLQALNGNYYPFILAGVHGTQDKITVFEMWLEP